MKSLPLPNSNKKTNVLDNNLGHAKYVLSDRSQHVSESLSPSKNTRNPQHNNLYNNNSNNFNESSLNIYSSVFVPSNFEQYWGQHGLTV